MLSWATGGRQEAHQSSVTCCKTFCKTSDRGERRRKVRRHVQTGCYITIQCDQSPWKAVFWCTVKWLAIWKHEQKSSVSYFSIRRRYMFAFSHFSCRSLIMFIDIWWLLSFLFFFCFFFQLECVENNIFCATVSRLWNEVFGENN